MSDALYVSMMGSVNHYSSKDKKRMKKQRLVSRLVKLAIYAGAIVGTAYGADNFVANAGIASLVCTAMECFR